MTSLRALVAVPLAATLVFAGCSKKKDATGPAASFTGAWSGTTSQSKPFHLLVENNGIVLSMIGFRVQGTTCTDDILAFAIREPPNQPIAVTDGDFTILGSSTARTYTATGTLDADGIASGTLDVTAITCNGSTFATWTAQRATGPEMTLTGTWRGSFYTSLVPTSTATYTLAQNGAALTGTATLATGGSFSMTGTVSGRMITFTATETTAGCTGSFSGHGTVTLPSETMLLYFTGSDCLGAHTGGFGSGTRQ
ncbi:MAG TPA: hypothetical protein VJL28_02410 [Gemmatimonadaceae bacterium]|nr:hypothetical protein [Gemmatimonadaceae bacterium]